MQKYKNSFVEFAKNYGLNPTEAGLLITSKRSNLINKLNLIDKVYNIDEFKRKSLKQKSEDWKKLNSTEKNDLIKNLSKEQQEKIVNDSILMQAKNKQQISAVAQLAATQTLIANELNAGLINVVGDIITQDGLDVKDRYIDFERTDSEFGQLDFIYGLDIMKIQAWSGEWLVENKNPQFSKTNLTALDTKDKISLGYRSNVSIFNASFITNGNSLSFISIEAKRALDTLTVYFNDVVGQDIIDSIMIGRHIDDISNSNDVPSIVDDVNNTMLLMQNENREFNEIGHVRATDKSNLILIAGSKYYAKSNRDKASVFDPKTINNLLGIKSAILENKLNSNNSIILMSIESYHKNTRINKVLSSVQASTSNTENWFHIFKRRVFVKDQQAVILSPDIADVVLSGEIIVDETTGDIIIPTLSAEAGRTLIINLIDYDSEERTVEATTTIESIVGEINLSIAPTKIGNKIVQVIDQDTNKIIIQGFVQINEIITPEPDPENIQVSQQNLNNNSILKEKKYENYRNLTYKKAKSILIEKGINFKKDANKKELIDLIIKNGK